MDVGVALKRAYLPPSWLYAELDLWETGKGPLDDYKGNCIPPQLTNTEKNATIKPYYRYYIGPRQRDISDLSPLHPLRVTQAIRQQRHHLSTPSEKTTSSKLNPAGDYRVGDLLCLRK
jgi:hypothetical protein